jgi:hypothetical protein
MREPLEIIAGIRDFISSQNPMRFPHQEAILVDLLNELENILNPQPIEEPVIEEPIVEVVEEQIVLMKNEEGIFEEFTVNEEPVVEDISESLSNILSLLETGAVEEPTVEVVAPKKRPRKV